MLQTRHLTRSFRGLTAIKALDLDFEEGKIHGLIGANGAGKTTLFNLISGFLTPQEGRILYRGRNLVGLRPHEVCRLGIARTFQIVKTFPELSVVGNVMIGGYNRHRNQEDCRKLSTDILDLVQLSERRDDQASALTLAMQKRLELAKALATEPKLLLLDESMAGLNPAETDEMLLILKKINGRGITIVMVEHVMKIIMSLCEHVVVLNYGEKIAEGSPISISRDRNVLEAYLGEGFAVA